METPETTTKPKAMNRMTEEEILQDYPHAKPGTLFFDVNSNKQGVVIGCTTEGCEKTRRVWTSDLWQVSKCDACTRKARRERARERRKAKKDADKAEN